VALRLDIVAEKKSCRLVDPDRWLRLKTAGE
jgi:hypothetical protein